MPIAKRMQIVLIVLSTITCAAAPRAQAQSENSRVMKNAEGFEVPTEAFEMELACIYEAAGWDATMNFAESAFLNPDRNTLRDSIAEEIADCARLNSWDGETQNLAFNAFLYSAMLEYNIEQTGSARLDRESILDIWNDLSNDDKAALVADNAEKSAALLARTAAAIRAQVPNVSDESVAYAQNALAAATAYASVRYQWSQKAVGN